MADAGNSKAAPIHRKPDGSCQPRSHHTHGYQHAPRNYKTLYDKELGAKETIRRYNGFIPGHPKYDVKLPLTDPRNHYIPYRAIPQADLDVPSFTIDRNTVFYPKVEVTLFKLNDNVNKTFLQQLAAKIAPPVDLEVFYHPVTKKHMGMAMIVFTTFAEAHKFVLEYNGKSIMGGQVICCHDPYFTLLSQRYEDTTGEEMRIPAHLRGLEETILNTRRSQLASKSDGSITHQLFTEMNCATAQQTHTATPGPHIMECAMDEHMETKSSSVPTARLASFHTEKPIETCTLDPDISLRKGYSTPRPRTPQLVPPLPRSLAATPLDGPPPTAIVTHTSSNTLPPCHVGFSSPNLCSGTGASISPTPPFVPGFVGIAYPPPPPYSALPHCGSTAFPQNYQHFSVAASFPNSTVTNDEMATTSQAPLPPPELKGTYGKRDNKSRQSRKKKKKKRRHSSDSSSSGSSSSSSLNVGEYLRVEKKEMSTKYISREREGLEKTIVEEIKTVTKKKKYRVSEPKRSDAKGSGLQMVSSDESVENCNVAEIDGGKNKKIATPGKSGEKEKKFEVHRWSSSSTESDGEQLHRKDKPTERSSSSHQDYISHPPAPLIIPPPPPPSVFTSPSYVTTQSQPHVGNGPSKACLPHLENKPIPFPSGPVTLLPTHLPPPSFPIVHMNHPIVAPPPFNPRLPPPGFPVRQAHSHPKRELPKVALRFVEDSPSRPTSSCAPLQQTLADRVASIFGSDAPLGSSNSVQEGCATPQRAASTNLACDDVDDMDVDIGSSVSPVPGASTYQSPVETMHSKAKRRKRERTGRNRSSNKDKKRFMRNVGTVREATEKVIGEEIVDVITKDFYKRIEGVSFEILEEVLAEIRHELEEQKRNEAQEALRAQAKIVTQDKPSDVSQLCSPLAASLNATPEKLGTFPFTINMPKLPSFRRKVRPPSPESESSRSPVNRRRNVKSNVSSGSNGSDAVQQSSSSSEETESSDEVVLRRKRRGLRSRLTDTAESGPGSLSEATSCETGPCRSNSPRSISALKNRDSPICSTAVSTASNIASSSESSPPSDNEDQDVSTATEEPCTLTPQSSVKEIKTIEEEIPFWKKILSDKSTEWSPVLPQPLYHVHLTEHCYFKLPEDGEKMEKSESSGEQKPQSAVARRGRLNRHDRELLGLFSTADALPKPKPRISYPPWSLEDKLKRIHQWDCCFDPEDQEYLKQAFLMMQPSSENGVTTPWAKPIRFSFTSWSDKPRLLDEPVKKGRLDQYFADSELDGILPIVGGCARTRGYFKMSMKEKRSLIRRPEDEQRDKTLLNDRDEAAVRHNLVLTKESRSMHRRLLTTMGDANMDFFKVNQLKYRKKMIKFARSRIHGWGLYAMEAIAPDDMIVEYVGQKVRNTVADVREKAYERRGIGSSYLFRIDDTTVIDATRMGNFARFINHSCQPNCYAKVVTVDGDKRIVIYSKTLINKGDEITYDYKFPIEEDKVDCLCGAPNCRGTLN
ncbi:hypothetical protein V3C99_001526 [Haemonchus contortus]